jgi:hypothetical protein
MQLSQVLGLAAAAAQVWCHKLLQPLLLPALDQSMAGLARLLRAGLLRGLK